MAKGTIKGKKQASEVDKLTLHLAELKELVKRWGAKIDSDKRAFEKITGKPLSEYYTESNFQSLRVYLRDCAKAVLKEIEGKCASGVVKCLNGYYEEAFRKFTAFMNLRDSYYNYKLNFYKCREVRSLLGLKYPTESGVFDSREALQSDYDNAIERQKWLRFSYNPAKLDFCAC
jgi:hypothetical protein